MFSGDVFDLLRHVITSWEVIVVVIALLLYLKIVFYVSRAYHRPGGMKIKKIEIRKKKPKTERTSPEQTFSGEDSNDELGLEEA